MLQTLIDDTRTSNVVLIPETPGEAKILFQCLARDHLYFGRSITSEKSLDLPTSGIKEDITKFYESLVGTTWNGVHYSKLTSLGSKLEAVSQEGKAHLD